MSRSKLFAALAAAGYLATVTPSAAVEVNPDGIGQVLLYPYYTVRSSGSGNALNTLITVGNATDRVKAVRVRFREGIRQSTTTSGTVWRRPGCFRARFC
jgi:hypothetical protein